MTGKLRSEPISEDRQDGQAIVVIALVLVVLLAFLALAIDGGNMYLQRRVLQNASDAAALSGTTTMLAGTTSEADIVAKVRQLAQQNGVDLARPGNVVHAWYVDSQGQRLNDNEIGTWGYVPTANGAAGVEVGINISFDAFVAQFIGLSQLSASSDSGAVVRFNNVCQADGLWANCDTSHGVCYNNGLNLSGSDITVIGAMHSNSGLHVTGSSFYQEPHVAEFAQPSLCSDGGLGICPPGYATVGAVVNMPMLYKWEDFVPGGGYWNAMCQGSYENKCHFVHHNIGSNDVISGGLWVVEGNVVTPRFFDPTQTKYTFVTQGQVKFNGDMPPWEPFVGSDSAGGSKAFIVSFDRQQGVTLSSNGDLNWQGAIFVPYAQAQLSAAGDVASKSGIYAWTINLSGANISFNHDPYFCPLTRGTVILLW